MHVRGYPSACDGLEGVAFLESQVKYEIMEGWKERGFLRIRSSEGLESGCQDPDGRRAFGERKQQDIEHRADREDVQEEQPGYTATVDMSEYMQVRNSRRSQIFHPT